MFTRTNIVAALLTIILLFAVFMTPAVQAATLRTGANAITTTALNFRTGPGTNYTVKQVVPAGTSVYVNAGPSNTEWYKVTYGGSTGYMYGRYLAQSTPSTGGGKTEIAITTTVLNLRGGPGTTYAVKRTLPAGAAVTITGGPFNTVWYKVTYGSSSGYVHGDYLVRNIGTKGKLIVVDISDQWLYAVENGKLVFKAPVSTGRDGFNTPLGTFSIFAKYPKQTMRGSEKGESWVVPDVPHVMYITMSGVALHGAYWHNQFGTGVRRSHGCVNLPLDSAAWLYNWAPLNTQVRVRA